ncbi:hypothetical protein Scep_029016 [Stephania cephalantha]|uniref:RING-type domain-containing protein n=1 Tax=Stephania cephalantha TaxID=152367 RepID=A0AAP0EJF4_9MAGN
MGLSSLPAPSEGMLCIILVNTAISLSIFKALLRSILHLIGIHLPSPESIEIPSPSTTSSSSSSSSPLLEYCLPPIEEIRKTIPSSLYSSISNCSWSDEPVDCSVCLARFKPDSQVSKLRCGHVFHKLCLEKWLDYWNFTCPLCRTPLTPHHDQEEVDPCI